MGDYRSGIGEPMHSLDVDAEVWREVPDGADGRGHVAWLERCTSPVVDGDPVRRRDFVPVERGVGGCDDRPGLRVGGRFTGEVAGIEFLEGGVNVVGVICDASQDPFVGRDLYDAEKLDMECTGLLVSTRDTATAEDKAFASSRDDRGATLVGPNVGEGLRVLDLGVWTVSKSRSNHPTAIVLRELVGQRLR